MRWDSDRSCSLSRNVASACLRSVMSSTVLITAEEPASGMAGPWGIFKASYHTVEQSTGNFLWLLCLITVNLGIFNLLPVPILDGGHVVLLLIEKVKGEPPAERFVAIFQYTGLVLLLTLIVFATYNDLFRGMGG